MKGKKLIRIFAVLLVASILIGGFTVSSFKKEPQSPSTSNVKSNIDLPKKEGRSIGLPFAFTPLQGALTFTEITMKVGTTDVDPNGVTIVKPNEKVTLNHTWIIENGIEIAVNDTYTFTLPSAFKVGFALVDIPIIELGTPLQVGSFSVSEQGVVVVTITDEQFLAKSDRTGEFELEIKFTDEVISAGGSHVIALGEGNDVEIQIDNGMMEQVISKNGVVDPSDNKYINWNVDINYGLEKYTSISVTDIIPLHLTVSEIKIYELSVKLDPANPSNPPVITQGAEFTNFSVNAGAPPNEATKEIVFNSPIEKAYRIVIKTKAANEANGLTLINNVELNGTKATGDVINETASASVPYNRTPLEYIQKEGRLVWEEGTARIYWTVRFNYDGDMSVPQFNDILSGHIGDDEVGYGKWTVDAGSFKVSEVIPKGNTTEDVIRVLTKNTDYSADIVDELNSAVTITQDMPQTEKSYKIEYRVEKDSLINLEKAEL